MLCDSSLPELRKEAQNQLDACIKQLAALPELPKTDPTAEVVQRVCDFCTHLQSIVYGRSKTKSFVDRCRKVYHMLMLTIRSTAPDFRPFVTKQRDQMLDEPSFQRADDESMGYGTSMSPQRSEASGNVDAGATMLKVDPKDLTDVRQLIKR